METRQPRGRELAHHRLGRWRCELKTDHWFYGLFQSAPDLFTLLLHRRAPRAPAPLRLPEDLQLTPEQFAALCKANPNTVLELDAGGHLIQTTPTGSETGSRNQALGALLWNAVRSAGLSLKLFDSSTGFRLPDGSVLSPDASIVREERWQALNPEQRRGFAPLCPDLVVELASPCAARWPLTKPMAPSSAGG